jgi:hypothetical protein
MIGSVDVPSLDILLWNRGNKLFEFNLKTNVGFRLFFISVDDECIVVIHNIPACIDCQLIPS